MGYCLLAMRRRWSGGYIWAAGAALAALGAATAVRSVADVRTEPLFLLCVVVVARRWGFRPALVATVASTALLDFFFLLPVHTLVIASANAAVDLALFALAAVLVSRWTTSIDEARREAIQARSEAANRAHDLAAVVEAADDGVVVFGADGEIKHMNGWFRAWWLVHLGTAPTTTDELVATLRAAASGAGGVDRTLPIDLALRGLHGTELVVLATREGRRRVRLRAAPIFDDRGVAQGAVVLWHDLTELPESSSWARISRASAPSQN